MGAATAEATTPLWLQRAREVTSHCSYADNGGAQTVWFRVLGEYAYMRSALTVSSQLLAILQRGGLLQGLAAQRLDEEGRCWVELTPLMRWRLHIAASEAFTLVDGTPWGAGLLLEELAEEDWPPPDMAEQAGLRWKVLEDHTFRPRDARGRPNADAGKDRYLCTWAPDPKPRQATLGTRGDPTAAITVGVCCLLRGAPTPALESWILYHLRMGFRRLYLFFDDPDDAGVPVARRLAAWARAPQAVRVVACSAEWWRSVRAASRFYRFRRQGWAKAVVDVHEAIRDVQCRQQLCVDLAIQEAYAAGLHWLLHIDVDELLHCPGHRHRRDVGAWFAGVEPAIDLVKFHNHECVPEDMEVDDWFREVTLFKPAAPFLVQPDDPYQPPPLTPPMSDDEAESDEEAENEDSPAHKALLQRNASDLVLETVAFARARHTHRLGLALPEPPQLRRRRARSSRRGTAPAEKAAAAALPETFVHFLAYANGKCAVRLRPAGGPEQPDSLPLPCGVHSFMGGVDAASPGWIAKLNRRRLDGPSDPAILHYANCGFSTWRRKYDMLGNFPNVVNGKQNTMRAHLAARDLNLRGDREQLELYYRMFVMSNLLGELPLLYCRGLVVRLDAARQEVVAARAEAAAAGAPLGVRSQGPRAPA